MWHFITLSDSDKHLRRQLLDHYANLAQLSALAPLALLTILNLTRHLRGRLRTHPHPSSPHLKHTRSRPSPFSIPSLLAPNNLHFFLTSPSPFPNFGTNALLLSTLLHTSLLLLLSTLQTQSDYLHLTKRLGLVAASQLPLHYLLAWKSPLNPISLLTGYSWEALNAAHQALGRIITFLFAWHAALYLNFFVQAGVLGKRIRDWDVILGLVAVVLYAGMGGMALGVVRRCSYRAFVLVHVVVAVVVLPVMWGHVSHLRVYVVEAVGFWVVGTALRGLGTRTVEARVRRRGEGLVEVVVEGRQLSGGGWGPWSRGWVPGQHVYLAVEGMGRLPTAMGRNPYSIASLQGDGKLSCMVRVMGGNTKLLVGKEDEKRLIRLEGPYGRTDHLERLLECDRVLLIAGGVGATFIMPLLRGLNTTRADSVGGPKVEAVWAVKHVDEVQWPLEGLAAEEQDALQKVLTVNLTREAPDGNTGSNAGKPNGISNGSGPSIEGDEADEEEPARDEGVEMQSLLKGDAESNRLEHDLSSEFSVQEGRPNVRKLVDQVFSHSSTERIAVYICGPKSMGDKVRTEVGSYVARGRDVVFWNEEFGLS
ncbi:Ferric reductase transmembrane component 1 [Elsinoe australis]|uniref:Ferric reductase transmembrane component 1 n=1 Tax=Elsinoe australis TaxID=40998 RepID=A0A2P8AI60_9PEZI|nr:Ferric reductase transmembrane component 1 [Elsinoe australis]